jgi:hypothetical protein
VISLITRNAFPKKHLLAAAHGTVAVKIRYQCRRAMQGARDLNTENIRLIRTPLQDAIARERHARRRKLEPIEIVLAMLVEAERVKRDFEAAEPDPMAPLRPANQSSWGRLLGRPVLSARERAEAAAVPGRPMVYAQEKAMADAVLRVLPELGKRGDSQRDVRDWDILKRMAAQLLRTGRTNASAIGREIGLSHVSVADRAATRSMRIIRPLENEFPDLFRNEKRVLKAVAA